MLNRTTSTELPETKRKLVDAGVNLMRARGFNATTVDEICAAAGVTKGGFFHYFKSKDEIAKVALASFYEGKLKDYAEAPFRKLADPMDRVFGRLDYVKSNVGGVNHRTKGCLIGVFAQELAFTNPDLRSTCQAFFSRIAEDFGNDLAAAKAAYAPNAPFDPKRLATLYVAIVQGSLLLAKVAEDSNVVAANIEEFRSYLHVLFGLEQTPATVAVPLENIAGQRLN
jgi:TetR/AcrR family transcriptional regulator, transcriptional repressor for nem operon